MRILIFGTVYADTMDKWDLARLWGLLHTELNPGCDLLLVDSASPHPLDQRYAPVYQLGNNIGHLAKGGEDGWGRAFCTGLQYALDRDYDFVVHIEGDSLCMLDVTYVCQTMCESSTFAMSMPVHGLKRPEKNWVETGLMFFDVDYLRFDEVIEKYNWKDGSYKQYPQTPEFWLRHIMGKDLFLSKVWRVIRDDRSILTVDNVAGYDWITHSRSEIYEAFASRVFMNA